MIQALLKVAIESVDIASDYLLENLGKDPKSKTKESHHSVVSAHDLVSEKLIIKHIKKSFPDHEIISEEQGSNSILSEYIWILDPLDGTSYYLREIPSFSISLAILHNWQLLIGVVKCPTTNERFVAVRNKGASLNSKPIEVSRVATLDNAVLSFGHKYLRINRPDLTQPKILKSVQSIRAGGSCAMELCYIACGRLDGVIQLDQSIWDYAAAMLILQEAGGELTNFDGNFPEFENLREKDFSFVASNKLLHKLIVNSSINRS